MRDYAGLVKELRYCGDRNNLDCKGCSRKPSPICDDELKHDAAAAIEELLAENKAIKQSNKDAAMRNKLLCDEISRMKENVPQWISVEERLPERWKHCLLRFKNNNDSWGGIELGYLASDGKTWSDANHTITHWMPLPEPPKEVE